MSKYEGWEHLGIYTIQGKENNPLGITPGSNSELALQGITDNLGILPISLIGLSRYTLWKHPTAGFYEDMNIVKKPEGELISEEQYRNLLQQENIPLSPTDSAWNNLGAYYSNSPHTRYALAVQLEPDSRQGQLIAVYREVKPSRAKKVQMNELRQLLIDNGFSNEALKYHIREPILPAITGELNNLLLTLLRIADKKIASESKVGKILNQLGIPYQIPQDNTFLWSTRASVNQ